MFTGSTPRLLRVAALFLLFFLVSAAIPDGPAWAKPSKVASAGGYGSLVARIAQGGSVRLLAKIDMPFQAFAPASSSTAMQMMNSIAAAQDGVLAEIAPYKPKSVHKYLYSPYLFVEADESALSALIASGRVLEIYEDIPLPPTFDGVTQIGAPFLWNLFGAGLGFDGTGVAVAVLDTGVDKNHPFLAGAVVSEACYSTNSVNVQSLCPGGVSSSTAAGSALPYAGACPAGMCDHGTHVAGIAAGRQGVPSSPVIGGVAPGANLIAIQVFSRFNSSSDCGSTAPCVMAYTSDIIKGLERVYEISTTFTIASANMSFGGGQFFANCDTDPTKPIIDHLRAAGVASVISSGNSGSCGAISSPACISSAVSVGASDDAGGVAGFSNSAPFLSLLAPGTAIVSSVPGTSYANKSGTSMAAPHISGAWALLRQAKPGDSADQILASLASTGISLTDAKCPSVTKPRVKLDGVAGALAYLGAGPSAETRSASAITSTGATLHGLVNGANVSTTVTFDYGTTTAYGSTATALESPVSGTALTTASAPVSGLTPNTVYHYRVKADDGSVIAYGSDMTFTTAGTCASITDGSFEGGTPSGSWAETSTNFGTPLCTFASCQNRAARSGIWFASFGDILAPETASLSQSVTIPAGSFPRLEFGLSLLPLSSGNLTDAFSVLVDGATIYSVVEGSPRSALYTGGYLLTGLDLSAYADDAAHTVSFRGTVTGTGIAPTTFLLDDVSLTCGSATILPVVTTGLATSVTTTGATLNGTVDANDVNTTVTFEYGTTAAYGSTVAASPSPVTGTIPAAVSAPLTGLIPGTVYHFRAIGSSNAGLGLGGDRTFSASCLPGAIRIQHSGTVYPSLQDALDFAAQGDVVQAKTAIYAENILFSNTGTVTFRGGFDCGFVYSDGISMVNGSLTIAAAGTLVLDGIAIR